MICSSGFPRHTQPAPVTAQCPRTNSDGHASYLSAVSSGRPCKWAAATALSTNTSTSTSTATAATGWLFGGELDEAPDQLLHTRLTAALAHTGHLCHSAEADTRHRAPAVVTVATTPIFGVLPAALFREVLCQSVARKGAGASNKYCWRLQLVTSIITTRRDDDDLAKVRYLE